MVPHQIPIFSLWLRQPHKGKLECFALLQSAKAENMSAQFVYLQFKVTPKGSLSRSCGSETIAIELPSKHVTDWKLERPGRSSCDEEIAIDLAQVVAIAAAQKFVTLTHRPLMEGEIHSSKFMSERLSLMNERECDYEDNGIRAWFSA
jgi:hypothetical protein